MQAQNDAKRLGLTSTIVGHVGDGNFHSGIALDPTDPEQMKAAEEFTDALAKTAMRLGGTVSGEHGIGLGKMKYMNSEHGAGVVLMRSIKAALDPKNILNPGKMLPPAE